MKSCRLFIVSIILLSTFSLSCSAHPGKTDSSGGHYDRSSGEYHYHHGYSAHQHTNGECPYDFKNNEQDKNQYYNDDSYFSKPVITTQEQTTLINKTETTTKSSSNKISFDTIFSTIPIIITVGIPVICIIIYCFFAVKDVINDKIAIHKSKKEAKLFLQNHSSDILELKKQIKHFKAEQEKLKSQYNPFPAYKILENTPQVPSDAFFNENRNIITYETDFPMTVYRSFSGECFHCAKGHGNSSIPMYIFDAAKKYYPCKICAKSFCNYEWYFDVYETIYLLEGFGIELDYLDNNVNTTTEYFLQICSDIITKCELPLYPSCYDFVMQECTKYIKLQKTNLLDWNYNKIDIMKSAYTFIADVCYLEIEYSEDFIYKGRLSHDTIGCNLYYLYKNIQDWAADNQLILRSEKTNNILSLKSLIEDKK